MIVGVPTLCIILFFLPYRRQRVVNEGSSRGETRFSQTKRTYAIHAHPITYSVLLIPVPTYNDKFSLLLSLFLLWLATSALNYQNNLPVYYYISMTVASE